MDLDRSENILKGVQGEYSKISIGGGPSAKQMEFANVFIRNLEPVIQLKKIGSSFEKTENQRLELLVQQSESKIKDMEQQNETLKRSLSSIDYETNTFVVSKNAQIEANEIAFKNNMKSIDKEIQMIKDQIDINADKYDELCETIEKIKNYNVDEQFQDES
jgi:hypothetical protein